MPHDPQIQVLGDVQAHRIQVALSRITGAEGVHKFGANHVVGTTIEDIWTVGGIYSWPTSAQTVSISAGGNAADTAAGAGARSVTVQGLDENWHLAEETIATAGASASASTATTFFRIFRAFVATAGTYTGNNTGNIDIENDDDNDTLARIDALYGQTQMSMYTVPAGKRAALISVTLTVGSNQLSNIRMLRRENADTVAAPFSAARVLFEADAFVGTEPIPLESVILLPEKTDIWLDGAAAASVASMNASYDLCLLDMEGLN
jgi:hypothetical protein